MVLKLRQLVLLLILGMVVFSPFMQMDSWDAFPVATGDLELHLIGTFCVIGMFLVFAGIMKLCPDLLRSSFKAPPLAFFLCAPSAECAESVSVNVNAPLRI